MAQRGQFDRSTNQRWKIEPERFRRNFEVIRPPEVTHLLYEIRWGRSPKTWKNFCTSDPTRHAEINFLENVWSELRCQQTTPCYITWFLSWSPCGVCSRRIIEFLAEHRNVMLEIRMSQLYRYYDERNQKGLRNLDQNGVKIAIMNPFDYAYCWRTFVACQGSGEEYWQWFFLQHIWFYSQLLRWILMSS
ncbi:C-_U-editing enzyme APOBEC-1-like [Tiliqua scincoides]|uniref:C->U-editing enzyme APOBEC-1-like n=1 Tax=Tiliqua scincoides TaxID=71010 RepID=UPI0034620AEE